MRLEGIGSAVGVAVLVAFPGSGRGADFQDYREIVELPRPLDLGDARVDALRIGFKAICGGDFLMGASPNDRSARDDERPRRKVSVSDFWISTYEITATQYYAWTNQDLGVELSERDCFECEGYCSTLNDGSQAAYGVSPVGAKMFCKWLSGVSGQFFRLPTEAEWEYACRAGTSGAYWFTDAADERTINLRWRLSGLSHEQPVSVYRTNEKPNPWGLFGMQGGVSEWVHDGYSVYVSEEKALADPVVHPRDWYQCVVRGGSITMRREGFRSSARFVAEPATNYSSAVWLRDAGGDALTIGFRVARPRIPPPRDEWERYWLSPVEPDSDYPIGAIPESWKLLVEAVEPTVGAGRTEGTFDPSDVVVAIWSWGGLHGDPPAELQLAIDGGGNFYGGPNVMWARENSDELFGDEDRGLAYGKMEAGAVGELLEAIRDLGFFDRMRTHWPPSNRFIYYVNDGKRERALAAPPITLLLPVGGGRPGPNHERAGDRRRYHGLLWGVYEALAERFPAVLEPAGGPPNLPAPDWKKMDEDGVLYTPSSGND